MLTPAKSNEECTKLLDSEMLSTLQYVQGKAQVALSAEELAAYGDFTYNVGSGAFAKSTLLRKLNAGDRAGACNELSRWVYAGGKRLGGLVKRRAAERELCLSGIE